MVRWPEGDLYSAAAMTSLISLMPARTALKETNSACVTRAMRRASVVLPQPGGPQNSIEPMLSLSICVRSGFPGPRSFSWPMNSSRVRGRMRSASGWLAAGTSESAGEAGRLENRLMDSLSLNRLVGKVKGDVGGALGFFGEAGAFVANKKGDGLAPVDFPGGEKRGVGRRWHVRLGMVKTRRNAAHG